MSAPELRLRVGCNGASCATMSKYTSYVGAVVCRAVSTWKALFVSAVQDDHREVLMPFMVDHVAHLSNHRTATCGRVMWPRHVAARRLSRPCPQCRHPTLLPSSLKTRTEPTTKTYSLTSDARRAPGPSSGMPSGSQRRQRRRRRGGRRFVPFGDLRLAGPGGSVGGPRGGCGRRVHALLSLF